MKAIFLGTPPFSVPTLERLLAHPHFEVIAAVTQPDRRRGRGGQRLPSAVKKLALEHHLPVWQPQRIKREAETLNQLRQAGADAFVVVAYGQILSPEILALPRLGCINVHASLLPRYRGAAPIQWSLYAGDRETGVTTMLMDEGMDTGPMLLKARTPISLLDNAHQVSATLAQQGAELLVETLLKLERGELDPTPQDPDRATYAPLIQKSDCCLDWSRPALAVHNQVRGFFPECVARFRDQPLKILATAPLGEAYWHQFPPELRELERQGEALSALAGSPGEVAGTVKNLGPIVQTGEGLLLLRTVQLPGRRPQSGWDFVNGVRLSVGEVLS